MISDTQTEYGVRSRCHGRSWRPCASNHCEKSRRDCRHRSRERCCGSGGNGSFGRPSSSRARRSMRVTARSPPCDNVRFRYQGPTTGGTKKVGLHLELIRHLRVLAVALEHPLRRAVFEVATFRQRRALDPARLVRLEPLRALERHAVPQRAPFHTRVDDRRAVGGRLEVAALFIGARNARVAIVVEIGEHGVDRFGRGVEPRLDRERVAPAFALHVERAHRRRSGECACRERTERHASAPHCQRSNWLRSRSRRRSRTSSRTSSRRSSTRSCTSSVTR